MHDKQGSLRLLLVILAFAFQTLVLVGLCLAWPDAASLCRPRPSAPAPDRLQPEIPWGGSG